MGRKDGEVFIKIGTDTKQFDEQIKEIEFELMNIDEQLKHKRLYKLDSRSIKEFTKRAEILNNRLVDLKRRQEAVSNNNQLLDGFGKGIDKVTKKVVKWSLALISVRSVYSGIRGAMSVLGQYDDSITARTEYLRWVLANALKPVIEWILKALYRIVGFVGQIIYSITGKNIFEHSGISDYEKALKNSNKNAKELKKTLTGFDEVNVLNEDGSVGVGSKLPSTEYDLSYLQNYESGVVKTTKKLINQFFDLRKATHDALNQPELFSEVYGNWGYFMQGLVTSFAGVLDFATGIGETLGGVLDFIVGLFTLNGEKILSGVKWIGQGLFDVVTGIIEFVIGAVQMVFGVIIGIGLDLFKGIIEIFSAIAKGAWDYVIKPVGDFFAGMWNGIVDGAKSAWEGIKGIFGAVASFFKKIFTDAWEGVKAVFSTGGKIFTGIKDGILEGFKRIVNVIIDGINKVVAIPFNGINKAFDGLRSVDLWGWKPFEWVPQFNVPQIPKLAKGGIINNPGPGVAIGGERGKEGVIPLTDAQQMALLGEAIGKYITINAQLNNYMNGRLISRELQKVQNEENFAFNR